MGLQNYNSVYLSGNRDKFKDQIKYSLSTKLILSFLFTMVVSCIASFIVFPSFFYVLLPWIIGSQIAMSFYVYLRSHFSIMGDYKIDSYFSGFDKLLLILILGYVIYVSKQTFDILQFAKWMCISNWIAVFICGIFVRIKYKFLSLKFSFSKSKAILKKCIPFAMVLFFMTLYTRMDGVMLERLLNDQSYSAGVYAAGFRIYDALNIIGLLFAGLLLPMFSTLISEAKPVKNLVQQSLYLLLSITAGLSIIFVIYRVEIMQLIYENTNEKYYDAFFWLMLSFFVFAISYIYGTLVTAGGNLKKFNLIFFIGIIVNWTLNLLLIPKLQAEGAAIATFITQSIVVLGQIILAFTLFDLEFNLKKLSCFIVMILILILGIFVIKSYLAHHWIYSLCISAIFCGLTPFLMGFLRWNNLLKLVKSRK